MERTNFSPSVEELTQELTRVRRRRRRWENAATVLCIFATIVAAGILVVTLWLPVVQVYDDAMSPTFSSGSLLMAADTGDYAPGDIIAFYHNNSVYVRRIIAVPGSLVEISEDGTVSVDGQPLEEPYASHSSYGQCDTAFPFQVPDDCYFVLGDNRERSIDSRSSFMGCVSRQRILGRILFCLHPMTAFGSVS